MCTNLNLDLEILFLEHRKQNGLYTHTHTHVTHVETGTQYETGDLRGIMIGRFPPLSIYLCSYFQHFCDALEKHIRVRVTFLLNKSPLKT